MDYKKNEKKNVYKSLENQSKTIELVIFKFVRSNNKRLGDNFVLNKIFIFTF